MLKAVFLSLSIQTVSKDLVMLQIKKKKHYYYLLFFIIKSSKNVFVPQTLISIFFNGQEVNAVWCLSCIKEIVFQLLPGVVIVEVACILDLLTDLKYSLFFPSACDQKADLFFLNKSILITWSSLMLRVFWWPTKHHESESNFSFFCSEKSGELHIIIFFSTL